MLEYIEGGQRSTEYGGSARFLAKCMLQFVKAHLQPGQLTHMPCDNEYELPNDRRDFSLRWAERKLRRVGFSALWQSMDPEGYFAAMAACQPTRIQFGLAYNAVRHCCTELPPTGNPAVVEVSDE